MVDRYFFGKTNCFIAVSETVRSFYSAKLRVSAEKIKVVYNGIDVRNYEVRSQTSEVRKNLGIKEDEKVLSIIGRLVPQKGVGFFLDALSHLSPGTSHQLKVLIVGEGPLKNSLQSTVHSQQLEEKVKFLGLRKDVPEILGITDILVLPSTREGLPMILLEAMAAGVIVIATRVGGTPELIQDGVNGYLVESGDVEGLKRRLEEILKSEVGSPKTEKDLTIDQIRINAKKTVEDRFSLKKMVSEHEKIYKELVES
jgi:glycosyltransferase involved in cell wall biosynthesis